MASQRISTGTAEDISTDIGDVAATAAVASPSTAQPAAINWASDDDALLGDMLHDHGFSGKLSERLVGLAIAPTHVKRPVDRLAIALGAQFNFLALDEAWQMPLLLCGLPGAGTSTLAAKLSARFDDSEILVISAGAHDEAKTAALAECLEVLDLPLTCAPDAAALGRAVAVAAGRKVLIDACGQVPLDGAKIAAFANAAGATGILVMSAETPAAAALASAKAASAAGVSRMIVTHLDAGRYLGAALGAADAAKLALVGATITPHFGFGMRMLTPQNLARRLMAALPPERWRAAPL